MTSAEIRTWASETTDNEQVGFKIQVLTAQALFEIAAQLAELNERAQPPAGKLCEKHDVPAVLFDLGHGDPKGMRWACYWCAYQAGKDSMRPL